MGWKLRIYMYGLWWSKYRLSISSYICVTLNLICCYSLKYIGCNYQLARFCDKSSERDLRIHRRLGDSFIKWTILSVKRAVLRVPSIPTDKISILLWKRCDHSTRYIQLTFSRMNHGTIVMLQLVISLIKRCAVIEGRGLLSVDARLMHSNRGTSEREQLQELWAPESNIELFWGAGVN